MPTRFQSTASAAPSPVPRSPTPANNPVQPPSLRRPPPANRSPGTRPVNGAAAQVLAVKPAEQRIPLTNRELDEAAALVEQFAAGFSTPYEKGRLRSLEQIAFINGHNLHRTLAERKAIGTTSCNDHVADGTPLLLKLADTVSRLNPTAGEIGAGMLAQLVADAKRALRASGRCPAEAF